MGSEIDYKNAKGWVTGEEADWLYNTAKSLPDTATILNIGVEYGKSLACLRSGNPTSRIVGLDIDTSKALLDGYGCDLVAVNSTVYFTVWKEPLDLVFVDGDHGKAGVLLDARFAKWVKVGGYIAFQDCWDWLDYSKIHELCPGVNAAVVEWFESVRAEFEELTSVGTTRVFRRIANVAENSVFDTNIQSRGAARQQPAKAARKS